MDLNYLLAREQISLVRATNALCCEARASHAGLARAYGALIDAKQLPFRSAARHPA